MFYIDTSVIVASLTAETSTEAAQSWLEDHAADKLAFSAWTKTEFYSAIAMKRRLRQISDVSYAAASQQFTAITRETFIECRITQTHFDMAADFVARPNVKLRAPDALHLAVVAEHAAVLVSLDQNLLDAAHALGIGSVKP